VYDGLEVRFIGGRHPDLLILDEADTEVRRIDLTKFATQLELHHMLMREGFELRDDAVVPAILCEDWAEHGQCEANGDFMNARCAEACDSKVEL
jgi:hypothetical protein